jgi:hypothetical protein
MACCTVTIVLAITISYKMCFENREASSLVKIGLPFLTFFYLAAYMVFYFGQSGLYFFVLKTVLFEVYMAFVWLTGFVLIAKMVPPDVSITLVAIF